jgi:hypothetical protein
LDVGDHQNKFERTGISGRAEEIAAERILRDRAERLRPAGWERRGGDAVAAGIDLETHGARGDTRVAGTVRARRTDFRRVAPSLPSASRWHLSGRSARFRATRDAALRFARTDFYDRYTFI